MRIEVLLFAQARESVGAASVSLELPAGSRVTDAVDALAREHPPLAALRGHLAVAVDGALARADAPLADGTEVALLPPVSGG